MIHPKNLSFALLFAGALISNLLPVNAYAASVKLQYGQGPFKVKTKIIGIVSFGETNVSLIEASGIGDGSSNYYQFMKIKDVSFYTINSNSNKPGMLRFSDLGQEVGRNFYRPARSGNFLIAGLGITGDDAIRINFSDLAQPINHLGMHWGSVQEPAGCCIRQFFTFTLQSGAVESFELNTQNAYLGRGRSSSSKTFFGFHVEGDFIVELVIEQLGHNPILDNVTFGIDPLPAPKGPPPIIVDHRNFGQPAAEPTENIVVQPAGNSPNAAEKALINLKASYLKDALTNQTVAEIAEIIGDLPLDLISTTYLTALAQRLSVNSAILQALANDPPRHDYDVIADYSGEETVTDFAIEFGPEFAVLDSIFLNWGYAHEALELQINTLERLQGAFLDNELDAFLIQARLFEDLTADSDNFFSVIAREMKAAVAAFIDQGIADAPVESEGITVFQFLRSTASGIRQLATDCNLTRPKPEDAHFVGGFEFCRRE